MNYQYLDSPVGRLRLVSDGKHLIAIEFENLQAATTDDVERSDAALNACGKQLKEYFAGRRREFDLPLSPAGTEFQQNVWAALQAIPYGELRSYRDIAEGLEAVHCVSQHLLGLDEFAAALEDERQDEVCVSEDAQIPAA